VSLNALFKRVIHKKRLSQRPWLESCQGPGSVSLEINTQHTLPPSSPKGLLRSNCRGQYPGILCIGLPRSQELSPTLSLPLLEEEKRKERKKERERRGNRRRKEGEGEGTREKEAGRGGGERERRGEEKRKGRRKRREEREKESEREREGSSAPF